jgi:2,3-dihydroxy-2,3-dihydrophenylpropionate dehydrogenase
MKIMGLLTGQVVLVTGGGSGLGRAIIDRFLKEGAHVGVLEVSEEKIAALVSDYKSDIVAIRGTVTRFLDNQRAIRETVARFGRLDCFIGNAAVWAHAASLLDMPGSRIEAAFDEVFAVNVKGYLLGAKAAAPELLASRGNIIFTLSNAAFYPGGGGPLYTASKHAGVGLVRQIAYELAPKVRVNAVAPSGMASDLRGPASLGQQEMRVMDNRTPEDRLTILPLQILPDPEDFVGPYVMLASPESNRTLSGVIINADCGLGIRGIRHVAGGLNL